jgi:RNA polymerase sigma-70 factor (ECF subfamily)
MLAADDPEMDYLRSRYADEFRAAFVTALGALPTRERNVLRLHLLDGLNVDRIGQLYDVHRATAARWLAHAREELFRHTRDTLRKELGLTQTEFASIVRLVRSELDVSICRILREC